MRAAVVLLAAIMALGCSRAAAQPPPAPASEPAAPPAGAPPPQMLYGRYFVEAGAPDPLACTADKECIGDTVTDTGGCCIVGPTPWPQTWAWHTWLSNRRMSRACKDVKCPVLPGPGEPENCAFDLHCVASKCKNSCKSN